MDKATGIGMYGDRLPYESNGSGWMQCGDSAVSGNGGGLFTDAQTLEYSPFDDEGRNQGGYPDEAGEGAQGGYPDGMEMEGQLPAGPAREPDGLPIEEAETEEREEQLYAEGQDAEEPYAEAGQQDAEKLDMEETDVDSMVEASSLADGGSEEESSTEEAAEEERMRAEHEAFEAKRKAEWEARQQAKKEAERAQMERIMAMGSEELVAESMKRVGADTEKLVRRSMKECVSEYVQTVCLEDEAFARQVMLPRKNMVRCFQYINRKAYEYVQDEMKAAGIQPGRDTPCYASDIPDDLCYHWAEEYFRTMDVKEDEEEEEKFVPKSYVGKTPAGSKGKKAGTKKSPKKPTGKKPAENKEVNKAEKKTDHRKTADGGQLSFDGQISFEDIMAQDRKAG